MSSSSLRGIQCIEADLTLETCDLAQKISAIIASSLQRLQLNETCSDLSEMLFVTGFTWPSFSEWSHRFYELAYLPRRWARLEGMEVPEPYASFLGSLREVSPLVRKVLLTQPYPMPSTGFINKFGRLALEDLKVAGLVTLVQGTFDKLDSIPLEHLRGIQLRLGIKGGRSRAAAALKIKNTAMEADVTALLLPDYQEDFVVVKSALPEVESSWICARQDVIRMYIFTLNCFLSSLRVLVSCENIGSPPLVDVRNQNCPVCWPHFQQKVRPGIDAIPPYHPGCSCDLIPESVMRHLGKYRH